MQDGRKVDKKEQESKENLVADTDSKKRESRAKYAENACFVEFGTWPESIEENMQDRGLVLKTMR
jgi:hypothetical protein